MAQQISPIILVGPTAVGKTEIAKELVQLTDGHLINSDRHYLYASNELCLGLGLEHGELEDGLSRHLYGGYSPHTNPPEPSEFTAIAVNEIEEIHRQGSVAIVEGCTRRYSFALLQHFGLARCVSVTWAEHEDPTERIRRRISSLSKNDLLLEETKNALDLGYRGTFPIGALMYVASAAVLDGTLTREQAEEEMIQKWIAITKRHNIVYQNMEGLHRVVHDRTKTHQVAKKVLDLIDKSTAALY